MPFTRRQPTLRERSLGLAKPTEQLSTNALDYFTNLAARTGWGTPSLTEATSYELVRLTYNYWELITLYEEHWISQRIVNVPAQDMVRAWPKLTSDITPKDITKIDRAIRRTGTKKQMLTALQWARLFGGAGCLIAIEGDDNKLDEPLNLDDVELGSYKGLIPFDRWAGISPDGDVSIDLSRPVDFGKPEYYTVSVQGGESFKVHASRILRFTGHEMPTPEKEAYSWWGTTVLAPCYEEIRKRDNLSWNILSLTFRANILGMKFPDLAALLSGLGMSQNAAAGFEQRMSAINHLISNQSLVPLPKDGGIESTSYTFSGLSEVEQQFQLNVSGAAEIPVTRLWGRTITGLGQSNDADERIYEEKINREQDVQMRPQMESKLYPVICASELGEVPDDIDLLFPSVRVLDEKEKSELAKTLADTVTVYLNSGVMSPRTVAKEIKQSSDVTGIGTNLTDEDIEALSDEVQSESELGQGLFGEEEGEPNLNPAGSPQKVLREMGQEKKAKAADVEAQNLQPGDKVTVNGKKLTVRKVSEAKNLFGEPELHVAFTTGEVVPADRQRDFVQAKDGPLDPIRSLDSVVEFKESEHPRDKGGKFSKGSGSSASKASLSSEAAKAAFEAHKGKHTSAVGLVTALVKEGSTLSSKEMTEVAQALLGTKTQVGIVSYVKKKMFAETPAGKAAQKKLEEGVVNNSAKIEEAKKTHAPVTDLPVTLGKAFVSTGVGGAKYIVEGVPVDLQEPEFMKALLAEKDINVNVISAGAYNPSLGAPKSTVTTITATPEEIKAAKVAVLAAAKKAVQAPASKVTTSSSDFAYSTHYKTATQKTLSALSPEQVTAVENYSDGGYKKVNKQLRAGQPLNKEEAALCASLDSAFKTAAQPFGKDTRIYRKMDNIEAWLGPNPTVGTVILDNGYLSTSARSGIWSGKVSAHINCKADQKALFIKGASLHSSEDEVVLPRGSMFKVIGYNKQGIFAEVHLEYLG